MAKTLINPFGGSDDEDFDVLYLINRNLQLGFIMIEDQETPHDADDCDLLGDKTLAVIVPEELRGGVEEEEDIFVTSDEVGIKMVKINEVTSNSMENLMELFDK